MSETAWEDKVNAPNLTARREDTASAAMLAMGVVYSIGFIMGGIVCGLVGVFAGWMIWG